MFNKEYNLCVKTFLAEIGKNNTEFECKKILDFKESLNSFITITNEELKTKGELAFKLWLAVGLVIDIVIW